MDAKCLPTLNSVRRNTEPVVCKRNIDNLRQQNGRDERQRQATVVIGKTDQQYLESYGDYPASAIRRGCLVCLFHFARVVVIVRFLPLVGILKVGFKVM